MIDSSRSRLVWAILVASFALFLGAVLIVPGQAAALVENVARPEPAQLVVSRGTVSVSRAGMKENFGADDTAGGPRPIRPGSVVKTDRNTDATLRFFDGSVVELRSDTTVEVDTSRQRIFANGSDDVRLAQRSGRTRITVAPSDRRTFVIVTPGGTAQLDPGTFVLPVQAESASLRTLDGGAVLREAGAQVTLGANARGLLARGRPPSGPLAAAVDLIQFGDFSAQGATLAGWNPGQRDVELNTPPGDVYLDEEDGSRVLRFRRRANVRYHAENYVLQRLDADVHDFGEVWVIVEFKLLHQSLEGGGSLHSEFPLELRMRWFDQSGQEHIWRQGYYARPRADGVEVRNGSDVGWGWTRDERLLTNLGIAPPDFIADVQLVASGWDYESVVRSVQIVAK